MKHEFHAQYSLALQPGSAQHEAVDYLTDAPKQPPKHWSDLGDVTDTAARIRLLAQAILTPYKDPARVGTHGKQGGLLHAINLKILDRFFEQQSEDFLAPLKLDPTLPDINQFPRGSWAINFKFTLQKPYISKDDTDFYILDNPVRKEWVFQVPYIAPSQWKGALRAAMVKRLVEEGCCDTFVDRRIQLTLLFGNEKEVALDDKALDKYLDKKGGEDIAKEYRGRLESMTDTGLFAGNLHFYPTYFTEISMEVINPHDRETGAGKLPIYFESVPAGAGGTFALLYVPVDCIGSNDDADDETEKQSAEMLRLVAEGVEAMLTEYGFGAKTSSGFGTAGGGVEDGRVEGLDLPAQEEGAPEPSNENYLKYLNDDGTVREEFCGDDGEPMSVKQYKRRSHDGRTPEGGGSQNEFKQFMNWYTAPAKSSGRGFTSLDGLVEQTKKVRGSK